MKIDWNRVLRTTIQAGAGAIAAFCTAIATDFSTKGMLIAGVQLLCTVITAFCMNISKQLEDDDEDDDDED